MDDGKKYSYLVLAESVRTEKGPRQRVILSLGTVDIPKGLWAELAEMIERRLVGQESLLPETHQLQEIADRAVERIRRKGRLRSKVEDTEDTVCAKISELRVEESRILGPVHVALHFWNALKMTEILRECELSVRDIMLTQAEVFGRLIEPMSEHATLGWIQRTAMSDLIGKEVLDIKKDALYRITDKVLGKKERIEELLARREGELFRREDSVYLYDLTSSYFEGSAENNPKARHGYSRDGRPDCKQIVVGLVLDREGFVHRHEVFEGNRQDITTLKTVVERLREGLKDSKRNPTIIVDRGMASEENLKFLREEGINYIVAARHNQRGRYFEEFEGVAIQEIETKRKGKIEVQIKEIEGEMYVLCWSQKREEKDKAIRKRFQQRLEESLKRLQQAVESGRLKDAKVVEEKIGRLKERYQRVSRYYEIETKEIQGVLLLQWRLMEEKEPEKYDGTYLLRTNRKDLSDEEIWQLYIMLTRVEKAFRDVKSNLGLRPIYHQKETRVDGHIFVSVLAYHLLHAIEYSLRSKQDTRSWHTIKQIVQTHQVLTIVLPDADGTKVHHIRVATEPDTEQKEVYEKLGINPKPIERKVLTIKKEHL